jgi:hypothetical protein
MKSMCANGKTYATITDDRPDEPRLRPHIDIGTEIEIPNNKLKWDKSNPTGHGVAFVSRCGLRLLLRAAGRGLSPSMIDISHPSFAKILKLPADDASYRRIRERSLPQY